jgi:FkbH-like protein
MALFVAASVRAPDDRIDDVADDAVAYRLARYVCLHPLGGGGALLMHPVRAIRHTIDDAALAIVERVRERGAARLADVLAAELVDHERARDAWRDLVELGYLVPRDGDDLAAWLPQATRSSVEGATHSYVHAPILDTNAIGRARERRPGLEHEDQETLPVVFLGACNVRYVVPAMGAMAPGYGYTLSTHVGFPNNTELIAEHDAKMVVLNPHIELVLFPLFDRFTEHTLVERRERLESYKSFIGSVIANVRAASRGRLLVVHGFSAPVVSAFGRSGFREELDLWEAATAIHRHIREIVRHDPDALVLDEERLLAAGGKRLLQDDWIREFRHHETSEDVVEELGLAPPSRRRAEIVAQEYLDLYSLWRRRGAIKLVVVDLDNTLWPGVVGESAFDPPFDHDWWRNHRADVPNSRALHPDVLMGFHEALKMLRGRGVLLATCSKNDEAAAMEHWAKMAGHLRAFLRPDDFVMHRINWRRKPENMRDILDATGCAPAACAFIDDSPHEREEMRQAFPALRIVDDEPYLLRWRLLEDQAFQSSFVTDDARQRAVRVQQQVARATAREQDNGHDFVKSLGIAIHVRRIHDGSALARVVELLGRTNQFNTTLVRRSAAELEDILARGGAVLTADVSDRFGDHGTVAVCVVSDGAIANFAMSCRVIGMNVAVPFLVTAIARLGADHLPLVGDIVDGPRNQPCRGLFTDAGFVPVASDGARQRFRIDDLAALAPVDPTIYALVPEEASQTGGDKPG